MTYAVDSNVILDILYDDPKFAQGSVDALTAASKRGKLVACEVVWAEASSALADTARFKVAMADFGIAFSPMSETASLRAGQMWKLARTQRKSLREFGRQHVVPDFLIGAHAMEKADALITRDRGFLRDYFSSLTIVDPTIAGGSNGKGAT